MARAPGVALEIEPAAVIEDDALALEDEALQIVPAGLGAGAALAARVDDSLPRHGAALVEVVEGVAHLSRVAADASEPCDLSVGRDAAAGDAAHDGVDAITDPGWPHARHRSP